MVMLFFCVGKECWKVELFLRLKEDFACVAARAAIGYNKPVLPPPCNRLAWQCIGYPFCLLNPLARKMARADLNSASALRIA